MSAFIARRKSIRYFLPVLMVLFSLQACSSEIDSARKLWPTECVGRMQFQLPGSADQAATFNSKVRDFKLGANLKRSTFLDGTPAPFAKAHHLISHPLTDEEKKKFIKFTEIEGAEVLSTSPDGTKTYRMDRGFKELKFPNNGGIVRRYDGAMYGTIFIGDILIKFGPDIDSAERLFKSRARQIFDVPKESGLCMPYIFVPDDGTPQRILSMSYRLKDHPDIQITLTDSSAFNPRGEKAYEKDEAKIRHQNKLAEPDPEIATFWEQWMTVARKYDSQWLLPPYTRPVNMAGFEGRQSFVRLTMDDGTLNYGYYAVVRGNPDAAVDTPDIRLYVRQDVKLAQGKTPLTKDQFIEMAQAIAKSVQRRPTAAN